MNSPYAIAVYCMPVLSHIGCVVVYFLVINWIIMDYNIVFH